MQTGEPRYVESNLTLVLERKIKRLYHAVGCLAIKDERTILGLRNAIIFKLEGESRWQDQLQTSS